MFSYESEFRIRSLSCKRSAKSYNALPSCELESAARRNMPRFTVFVAPLDDKCLTDESKF